MTHNNELKKTKERLERSLAAGNIAWWEMEYPSGRVEFNEHKVWMLGYTMEEFAGCDYRAFTDLVHPEDYAATMRAMGRVLEGETDIYEAEYRIRAKDGSYKWFYDRGGVTARDKDGAPTLIKGVVLDISERKASEQRLKKSVDTQKLLLKELHHRTKNNLNMISALIYTHKDRMRVSEDAEVLDDLLGRLQALSKNYDYLSPSGETMETELCAYLSELLGEGEQGRGPRDVRLEVQCEHLLVSSEMAVPIGMIVHELVTNAYKHAFPGGRRGTIRVALQREKDALHVSVEDDGVGAADTEVKESDSFGMTIVEALVDRLEGNMEIDSRGGMSVRINLSLIE